KRPPDAAAPIQASSQLDVTPESRADRTTGQPTYQADNPKNKLHLVFGASGVHLSPSAAAFPVWSLDLALAAVGFDDQVTAPGPALLSASGTRVNYDFEAVRQWYVNTDSDLEQGFRVSEPPSDQRRQGTTTITLDLSVDGDLKPTHVQPSYFIDFVAPNGETVLRYGAWKVGSASRANSAARDPPRVRRRPGAPRGPQRSRGVPLAAHGLVGVDPGIDLEGQRFPRPSTDGGNELQGGRCRGVGVHSAR